MATTTIFRVDLQAGKVPRVCVKTGSPAEVDVPFAFGEPSRLSWVTGTIGCTWLILVLLPISVIFVPIFVLTTLLARRKNIFSLPMTRNAARRLRIGRWGGVILLAVVSIIAIAAAIVSPPTVQGVLGFYLQIGILVFAGVWFIAVIWVALVAAAFLQPGGGVPLVGIQGLHMQSPIGAYVELHRVHKNFADAVYLQYHPLQPSIDSREPYDTS